MTELDDEIRRIAALRGIDPELAVKRNARGFGPAPAPTLDVLKLKWKMRVGSDYDNHEADLVCCFDRLPKPARDFLREFPFDIGAAIFNGIMRDLEGDVDAAIGFVELCMHEHREEGRIEDHMHPCQARPLKKKAFADESGFVSPKLSERYAAGFGPAMRTHTFRW